MDKLNIEELKYIDKLLKFHLLEISSFVKEEDQYFIKVIMMKLMIMQKKEELETEIEECNRFYDEIKENDFKNIEEIYKRIKKEVKDND